MLDVIIFKGSCHCGQIEFQIKVPSNRPTLKILDCNCTICTKKGILHLVVPPEHFSPISGCNEDPTENPNLKMYCFLSKQAKHRFCSKCGCHPFYRAKSHPNDLSINIRCLQKFDPHLENMGLGIPLEIIRFDGRNSHTPEAVAALHKALEY